MIVIDEAFSYRLKSILIDKGISPKELSIKHTQG